VVGGKNTMPVSGKSWKKIKQRQLNEIFWEEKFLLSFSFPKRIQLLELKKQNYSMATDCHIGFISFVET
jgi:hypothetical protein